MPVRPAAELGEILLFDFRDFNFHASFVKRRSQLFLSFYQIGNHDPHFYVGCETIGLTEPCGIGRATCDDFAVKSDCVDFSQF